MSIDETLMDNKTIQIALTFNENYVIPAGVAMYSLLKTSDPKFRYEFYILHHGLSVSSQKKLIDNLSSFKNFNIDFIFCNYSFDKEFINLKSQQHFSQEMFYKLLLPSLLPNCNKVIVSDVDVLFKGDVSNIYINFTSNNYIAAVKHYSKTLTTHLNNIYSKFDNEYKKKINNFGAGFYICNLKKMREDGMEDKMLSFLKNNIENLVYPEQEVINYVCFGQVEYIDIKYMTVVDWIKKDLINNNIKKEYYSIYHYDNVVHALDFPVQLHFASSTKPWNDINCTGIEDWIRELCNTIFLKDYLMQQAKGQDNSDENISILKNKFCYYCYKILSEITFGKMRKHYKKKRKELKTKLKKYIKK